MTKLLFGAHMSISGGVHMAIERAWSIQCSAIVMSSEVETSLIVAVTDAGTSG